VRARAYRASSMKRSSSDSFSMGVILSLNSSSMRLDFSPLPLPVGTKTASGVNRSSIS